MGDLSIMIKIGGRLEKSFGDAVRDAQSGLSGLNAAISKEMAEAGNISSAAAAEMKSAGRMFQEAFGGMASAGRMGASASREMASGGMAAAASSRGMADAGKETASIFMEMAAEGKKAADAVRGIASTGKVTSSSVRDIASAVKGLASGFRDMSAQAGKASKDMMAGAGEVTSLSTNLAEGGRGITSLSKEIGGAGEMAGAASAGFVAAGAAITATAAVAAAAGKVMKEVGEYSVQVGMEFESAMSDAAATANAGAEDFAKMEQAAMEMGKTTSKTASESAKALEYMSLAGWDVDTSVSALPSVLKMSEASGMDLSRTSDLVTDSMAALGVTVDQLPGYLDVAAKAQTKSNQSTEQLMEAYIGVGGTMKNLGIPITESATALGVLANRGIKGSEAGNALNAVMVNLTTGTGQAGKMMQSLGVSAFDQQGKFIGLEETLQQLNTSLQGCSEEQRNAALAAIGGKQHIDALNDLMAGLNTTNEEGISEWAALTSELENCSGSLQAMRDMKLDNLGGDLKTLESAAQDAGIKIYKHLNTPLREFAQFGTQEIYQVSDALESGGFAGMADAAGSALAHGMGMVIERAPEFLAEAAVSVGSFLVGFATELPASLLTGIMKGAPRLLKALPGIGVDIVKAIIKGIFSVGSAPLKAVGSLFFGGGDAAETEDADIGALKDSGFGPSGDAAPTADTPQAVPMAPADSIDLAGDALAMAGPSASINGQAIDIPDIVPDTKVIAGEGAADKGFLRAGAEQAPAGIPVDTAQPADMPDAVKADMPAAADAVPAFREAGDLQTGIPGGISAEIPAGVDAFAETPAESLPIPSEGAAAQPLVSTEGTAAKHLPVDIDITGISEDFTVPSIDAVQDIELAPSGPVPDIPAETVQISPAAIPEISMKDMQVSPDVIPDMTIEAAQMSAGAVPDMASAQIPGGAAQVPAGTTLDTELMGSAAGMAGVPGITQETADKATTGAAGSQAVQEGPIQEIVAQNPKNVQIIGNIGIPPVSIGMTGIGDGIAQARNIVRESIAGSFAGKSIAWVRDAVREGIAGGFGRQTIRAAKIDVDSTGQSGRMGYISALSSQAFTGGIEKGAGSAIDTSQTDAGMTGVRMDRAAQMPEVPLQLQGMIQVPEGVLRGAVSDMTEVQNTAVSTKDMPGISPGTGPLPAMMEAQKPDGSAEAVSGWLRSILDVRRSAFSLPGLDIQPERSVIDEVLEILLGKRKDQDAPEPPGGAPTFVFSPTYHIEGSGDTQKDIVGTNQICMRDFDKFMKEWLRQNGRTALG